MNGYVAPRDGDRKHATGALQVLNIVVADMQAGIDVLLQRRGWTSGPIAPGDVVRAIGTSPSRRILGTQRGPNADGCGR